MNATRTMTWCLAVVALASCSNPAAQAPGGQATTTGSAQSTFTGTISDSMCKLDHSGMLKMPGYGPDAATCVKKCVSQGEKLILIEPSGAQHVIANPQKASGYEGKTVTVTGSESGSGLQIQSIR